MFDSSASLTASMDADVVAEMARSAKSTFSNGRSAHNDNNSLRTASPNEASISGVRPKRRASNAVSLKNSSVLSSTFPSSPVPSSSALNISAMLMCVWSSGVGKCPRACGASVKSCASTARRKSCALSSTSRATEETGRGVTLPIVHLFSAEGGEARAFCFSTLPFTSYSFT